MQTIITKYHGPTDRKVSRVSATSESGERVMLSWDYALNNDENHKAAARALCDKLGWHGTFQGGNIKKQGMAFCFIDPQDQITV